MYIQWLSDISQKTCQISEDVNVCLLNPKSNSAKEQSSERDVQYSVSIFKSKDFFNLYLQNRRHLKSPPKCRSSFPWAQSQSYQINPHSSGADKLWKIKQFFRLMQDIHWFLTSVNVWTELISTLKHFLLMNFLFTYVWISLASTRVHVWICLVV